MNRKLKKWVEYTLVSILMTMGIITLSLCSFELTLSTLIISVIWFGLIYFIYRILVSYGKGLYLERD